MGIPNQVPQQSEPIKFRTGREHTLNAKLDRTHQRVSPSRQTESKQKQHPEVQGYQLREQSRERRLQKTIWQGISVGEWVKWKLGD